MKAPYTERYVRCCERTGANHSLLLDCPRPISATPPPAPAPAPSTISLKLCLFLSSIRELLSGVRASILQFEVNVVSPADTSVTYQKLPQPIGVIALQIPFAKCQSGSVFFTYSHQCTFGVLPQRAFSAAVLAADDYICEK